LRGARAYAKALEPLLGQAAGYARAVLRNRQDAEDAVQEAAFRGWQRFDTFDAGRSFKGWWFAILRNCCIDMLRRSRAAATEPLEDRMASHVPDESGDWERLAAGIAAISADHREILRLRYFGEMSYTELAEALGIPPGTVMSRLHLARKALAATLGGDVR
jgi:RNA polymerase sigma-70 factor, ECF subfamily